MVSAIAAVCALFLAAGCVAGADVHGSYTGRTDWIEIGRTTRDEVLARFGDPDSTAPLPSGEIAVYRVAPERPTLPPPSIPTFEAGPLGTTATKMKPLEPGLGTQGHTPPGGEERLARAIWIRYDARGVVQELGYDAPLPR